MLRSTFCFGIPTQREKHYFVTLWHKNRLKNPGIWLKDKHSNIIYELVVSKQLFTKFLLYSFLYRNKHSFHLNCRKTIEATFLTFVDHEDVVYQHATACALKPLDSIYHFALRCIGDNDSTHFCILYYKVSWPTLFQRSQKHWYLFLFKTKSGTSPSYISLLLLWHCGPSQHTSVIIYIWSKLRPFSRLLPGETTDVIRNFIFAISNAVINRLCVPNPALQTNFCTLVTLVLHTKNFRSTNTQFRSNT